MVQPPSTERSTLNPLTRISLPTRHTQNTQSRAYLNYNSYDLNVSAPRRIQLGQLYLFQVLRLRRYSRSLYRELKYNIWQSNYCYNTDNTTQKNNNINKVWPIINYFDNMSVRLAHKSRTEINTVPVAQKYKLNNAYKIHDNLKRQLCRSRFTNYHT